ncbi:MAG TPA: hypothetical protein VFE58_08060, partial [Tepidisphaeraceae bacterium]|nr:hypothetical protein [Tepidisphaeraceae bacterium]
MDKATPGMARVLVVVLLGVSGVWGQSTRPVRREIVRYTTGQRVEFLRTDEWEPATVLGWENRKVRVRTDGNEEFLAQTVQVRKFTNAASYPVKAAAEDIAAINPTPAGQVGGVDEKQLDAIKPGLAQPAEADPVEEKAKVVAPAPVVVREETLPLPPAPNVLPGEVVAGDLTTATGLAAPEKVETRAIWERDGAAGLAHPVSGKGFVLRELDTQDAVFEGAAPLLFTSPEFGQVFVPHRDRSPEAATDLYYDRYDCATGERTGGFAVPPGGKVLDLSGDGT